MRSHCQILLVTIVLGCLALAPVIAFPHDLARNQGDNQSPIRIGAVAYSPSAVTIFEGIKDYLNSNGFKSDYVLYSNYDSLVDALAKGEIEIAWNTPLAHGKYHVQNDCASQTLVMRDVDVGVQSVLVARRDCDIESINHLSGKHIVLGSSQAAEATVLPLHFLKKEGLVLADDCVVSLDQEVDSEGNPCASPQHVLRAVLQGRGDAGIITSTLWNRVKNQPGIGDQLQLVWTSPEFSHCVFTAAPDFDEQLGNRFRELMTTMDPNDPNTAEIMRLEGTKKWLPGKQEGFEDLFEALQSGDAAQ